VRGLLVVAFFASVWTQPAKSAEFQQSPWPRGYYDIFAGFLPEPGVYVRNDLIVYDGRAAPTAAFGETHLSYTVDVLRVTAFTPYKILGATYGFSLVGTLAGVDVGINLGAFTLEDAETGIGDSGLTPALFAWKAGNFNASLIFTFIAPTGDFSLERAANLGRNHWTFAPQVTFTWFDAEKGLDLSGAAIYTTSWENEATRYRTGDFLHFEGSATKVFGPLRFGVTGFAQKQITDDSGPGATLGGFRSDLYGIGPLIGATLSGGDQKLPLFLNLKWVREFGAENAFEGDTVTANALFRF
jgi:hypothetical protein